MFQTMIRKGFAFFLALLLTLSYSLTAINPIAASANTVSENEPNSFKTTLVDRTTKSDRLTFDIWAKDAKGNKISTEQINVTNNSKSVAVNWDDSEKTSYTLNLSTGENKVNITINGDVTISKDYKIINVEAENGENIGDYIFSLDAFTVGLGYIVEPTRMPIYKGQNAAQILDNQLTNQGFSYNKTGSLESGFYLSAITKNEGSIYDVGVKIPKEIEDLDYGIDPEDHGNSLGEFDFNYMSGWMYKLNNVFPNVGFSDSYLQENDVMSVQFTVGYGAELGGGWSGDAFPAVNRDEITKQLAYINSAGKWKTVFLENNNVQETYEKQMVLMAKFGVEQNQIDALVQEMNAAIGEVINPLIAGLPESISSDNWKSITETVEAIENTTESQQKTFDNIEKYNSLKAKYDQFKIVDQLEVDFAKLPEVSEVTLAKDLKNTLKLQDIYLGLDTEFQNLIENRQNFMNVLNQINVLLDEAIAEVIAKIDALPAVENLALSDEELISTIDTLIAKLDYSSQLKITNTEKLTQIKAQLVILKNNKKVADVIALINDLPEKEKVVLGDKAKIKEVRAAYTALSTTLRKDVTNFTKLTDAEAKISWYEASNTVFNSIENLPTLEALNFGNEARVKSVRASYNKLDDIQKAGITNISKLEAVEAKLVEYAPIKAVETLLTALPTAYSTKLTDQEKITKARAEYDKLSEDYKKVVQSSLYNRLIASETKLQTLIDTASIAAITNLINKLPTVENATLTDFEAVKIIRNQYDTLTTENKAKVSNYELFELVEKKVIALETAVIQEVEQLISKLPTAENLELFHEKSINEAEAAYEKLTVSQLERVKDTTKQKLQLTKQAFIEKQSIAQVNEVISLINTLPQVENLMLEDETKLVNTKNQLQELTNDQLQRVTNKAVLDILFASMNNLKMYDFNAKINEVNELISVLPAIENIDLTDESKLNQITKKYDRLSDKQKQKIIGYSQIANMQSKIANLTKVSLAVFEDIAKLPKVGDLTGKDRPTVEKVRNAFTQLTAGQQALVKNESQLEQIERALAQEESNAVLKVVIGILSLPELDKATLENNLEIMEWVNKYEDLSSYQKELITNVSKLHSLNRKMDELQQRNNLIAQQVIEQIATLRTDITIDDKSAIEKVRAAYEKLTIEQQAIIHNYDDLVQAEKKLAPLLEEELKAVAKVETYIKALPTVSKLTIADESAVKVVRKAYNSLTPTQKALVKSLSILEKVEAQIEKLQDIVVVTSKTAKMTVSSVKNTSTTISGTASKHTTLSVYKGSKLLTSAAVNSSGKYSLKIAKQSKDTKLKIVQKNSKGATVKNTIITVKAAVVAKPKSMKATANKVTGVATSAKKVIVYRGSTKLATVSVSSKGTFSATIKTQKNGTKLSVVAYDSVNNKSKKVTATVNAVVASPKSMKASTKKVTGKSTGAKKVIVYRGSTKLATVAVSSKGTFSASIKTQKKGTKLTVVAYDSVNNKSKKVTVTVK